MRNTLAVCAILLVTAGVAPTASSQARGGPAECPMALEGADVAIEEIDGGVAVTYTTARPEEVQELRARVRSMASLHEQRAASRPGRGRHALPPAVASVADVPEGARLELAAVDPGDVEALRERVAMRAERMAGGCPMMEPQPPA